MRLSTFITSVVAVMFGFGFFLGAPVSAIAETVKVPMHLVDDKGTGKLIGDITFADKDGSLELMVALTGLPVGERGFHIHENPSCLPAEKDGKMVPALAAGGHYDPNKTKMHMGPGKGGHEGDLPFLTVGADGSAKQTLIVKGLTVKDVMNRAIMIHAGGDNYSDQPVVLGGGGPRIACGVIK